MRIDQRNGGGSISFGPDKFSVDRWKVEGSANTKMTAQQSSVAPAGFTNSLLITTSSAYSVAAGDFFGVFQPVEGYNIADLAWGTASAKSITISFWVRSSLTGTFGGAIENNAATRCYVYSYTISAANTWEYKTVTIPGDTTGTWLADTNRGLVLRFGLGVGTTYSSTAGAWGATRYFSATGATSVVGSAGATFYLTGVQLEVGVVATPFEFRPIATETALCQRYYEVLLPRGGTYTSVGNGSVVGTTACYIYVPFAAEKRSTGYTLDIAASSTFEFPVGGTYSSMALTTPNSTRMAGLLITISGGTNGQSILLRAANNTASQIAIANEL